MNARPVHNPQGKPTRTCARGTRRCSSSAASSGMLIERPTERRRFATDDETAAGTEVPTAVCVVLSELLRRDHLEGDRRRELVVEANRRLVVTDGLDGRGDLDLALVDVTEARRRDRSRDIRDLHRTEQAAAEARLDGQSDLARLELGLKSLRVVERVHLASGTSRLDLLDLLLATAGPRRREALGNQVVARVAVLDLDDVAGRAEAGDLVRENNLCHC